MIFIAFLLIEITSCLLSLRHRVDLATYIQFITFFQEYALIFYVVMFNYFNKHLSFRLPVSN